MTSYITTVEGMTVDYETLYNDMMSLKVDEIMKFLMSYLRSYLSYDERGTTIVKCVREDGSRHVKDDKVIQRICKDNVVEWVVNKSPSWRSDDPRDFTCGNVKSWIECDYDNMVKEFLEWREDT